MQSPNSIAMALLFAITFAIQAHAESQSNRHSYSNSQHQSFSFEQHASVYADATWTPDNEITISAANLRALLPKKSANTQLNLKKDAIQPVRYSALVSDKSFGISAQISF